jgi:hypothetical protein|tara:strand:- start:1541 stop:1732 length:192 start_codon:yes stop_codon:yes gene_type:complete
VCGAQYIKEERPGRSSRLPGSQRTQDKLRLKSEQIFFALHNKIFVFSRPEMFIPEAFDPNIGG